MSVLVIVVGIVFGVLTFLPGSPPDDFAELDSSDLGDEATGRAMVAAKQAQSVYRQTCQATMFPQLFGGSDYFFSGRSLVKSNYQRTMDAFERLADFEAEPTTWDRRASMAEDPKYDCTDFSWAIDKGLRDQWGRVTEKGLKQGKARCPARFRKRALAKSVGEAAETTTEFGNDWLARAWGGKWIFRLAGLLAVVAALFGFLGRPKVFGGILIGAGTLPLAVFIFPTVNFMILPLAVVAFLFAGIVVLLVS